MPNYLSKIRLKPGNTIVQIKDANAQNSITNLTANLQTEINNRTNADAQLQTDINGEKLARQQADTQLQNKINNITFGNTKYNVVDDMPSELENASLYEDIESDINYSSIPTSSVSEIAQKAINRIDEDNANGIFEIVSYNSANEPSVYHSLLDGFWKYSELKKALMSFGCNIALLQETVSGEIFNIENLVKSTLMKYSVNDDEMELSPFLEQCLTTFSYNNIISNQYIPFTNRVHNEGLQKSVIRIGNKIVSVYNVHIYYVSGSTQDAQWNEMLTIIGNDSNTYKLIGGDLNVNLATYSKVSAFERAGYKVLNKGQYITYPANNTAIDGFITTSNIKVLEINLAENEFTTKMNSDHLPIRARLKLV